MLTLEEVRNIALLGRVGLEAVEEEKYQKELSSVLDFFRELEKADTDSVEPIRHITGRTGEAREDVFENDTEAREIILKNFPDTKDNFVKVRSVF